MCQVRTSPERCAQVEVSQGEELEAGHLHTTVTTLQPTRSDYSSYRTMAYHAKAVHGLGWTLVVLGTISTILGTAAVPR
ncbi:Hypp3962 [Branchiostoma lanceolatum]|uniref:Hypp3962 protein n=1 Tax=Branchiostoma lanceolatum TaxID=7740 RepID=A0A8K0A5W6_BRALA|nr:Hypp3962 [Branchiostoma lanceolatum]